MIRHSLTHLADDSLLTSLRTLVTRERMTTAELLAHLAEVDARKLFAPLACASMHAYCVRELGFSEDEAFKRIQVARAGREFPAVFEMLAAGTLSFTVALKLAPHLTPANADELLREASGRTKEEIASLLAQRFPRPDVPAFVKPIGAIQSGNELVPEPVEASNRVQAPGAIAPPSRTTPLAPERFALQVTISGGTQRKLERARELLSHAIPDKNLAQVLDRALDALIAKLEKRRTGATTRPGRRTSDGKSRYVPAEVKRAVWARDGSRCTFVGTNGQRCDSRTRLELDHVLPIAKGGAPTAGNLRLRCRAHNQYEAERALGERFMNTKRDRAADAKRDREEREARENDPDRSVIPWLRHLGCSLERARALARTCDALEGKTVKERLKHALSSLAPARPIAPGVARGAGRA